MSTARRMLAGVATAILVAAPAMSCGQKSAAPPEPTAATSTPEPATSSAAPASDEELIRQTLAAFQVAYNTENWDDYLALMCTAARDLLTDAAIARLKETRVTQGLTDTTVTGVDVRGDAATATVDARNELLGRRTIQLDLVREDGWKVCQTTPVR